MNEEMQEFINVLKHITGVTDDELEAGIQRADTEGIKKMFDIFKRAKAATNEVEKNNELSNLKATWESFSSPTYAKLGAKLNYIKSLRGDCPEGMVKYKSGGKTGCKPCMQQGGDTTMIAPPKKRFDDELSTPKVLNEETSNVDESLPTPVNYGSNRYTQPFEDRRQRRFEERQKRMQQEHMQRKFEEYMQQRQQERMQRKLQERRNEIMNINLLDSLNVQPNTHLKK